MNTTLHMFQFRQLLHSLKPTPTVFLWAVLITFYALTHLAFLTKLPVFADESIYIRWSQLIIDDPGQYFFFALNDGKTPLFMWLLVPFQLLPINQLWSARFLSVLIGLAQVLVMGLLTKQLGGRRKTQALAIVLTTVLPYWYFHHRMALTDGLLVLMLSLYLCATVAFLQKSRNIKFLLAAGLSFGLALWSKVPAILIAPVIMLWGFLPKKKNMVARLPIWISLGLSLFIGLLLFISLRISPAFGQLFSRGSDFLWPWQEVLFDGKWQETLPNIPTYLNYFTTYTHPLLLLLFVFSLFSKKRRKIHHLLFWSACIFALPMAVMGKVVYARYFLPIMIFLTVAVSLYLEELFDQFITHASSWTTKMVAMVIWVMMVANIFASSGLFIYYNLFAPAQTPFVASDRGQYLLDWSSGHGVLETVNFITETAQTHTVAVATEGTFGTLPDGILMYFHRRPIEGIYIEGIGQPVTEIPQFFTDNAKKYQKRYLVVNAHRLQMTLDPSRKVKEFCRPDHAPCLQIWDIGELPN